jgi:hypothetical protein
LNITPRSRARESGAEWQQLMWWTAPAPGIEVP